MLAVACLRKPTRLADGFGVGSRRHAHMRATPRIVGPPFPRRDSAVLIIPEAGPRRPADAPIPYLLNDRYLEFEGVALLIEPPRAPADSFALQPRFVEVICGA